MSSPIAKFYDLEALKITADGEKISLFTGHPGTLGTFREARLKQYLRDHVGDAFTISEGFITRHDPDGEDIYDASSRQIDALIYDGAMSPPLLRTDDFVVVAPSSVAAVVEVKSDLTITKRRKSLPKNGFHFTDTKGPFVWDGTLVAALENVVRAIEILKESGIPRDSYFAGIIGYDSSALGQFAEAMRGGELLQQLNVTNLDALPNDICVLKGQWFAFSAYKWTETPEEDHSEGSDPTWAFLLESDGKSTGGSLQLFTAELDFGVHVSRGGRPHVTGGLRSGRGFQGVIKNHKIPVTSARQHSK